MADGLFAVAERRQSKLTKVQIFILCVGESVDRKMCWDDFFPGPCRPSCLVLTVDSLVIMLFPIDQDCV
jgi:hypothetical protein